VKQRSYVVSFTVACIVLAAGVVFGWRSYVANPEGVLLYTPKNWCEAARVHTFTIAFFLILIVGFAILLAIAILSFSASLLSSMAGRKTALRFMVRTSALSMLFVAFGSLLHIPVEAELPLQKISACAPNVRPNFSTPVFRRGQGNAEKLTTRNCILAGESVRGQFPKFFDQISL
jgi:hypothetical protein